MYYILYIIFFISSLLYGSYYIGPVTPRQLMTVLMFLYLFGAKKLFVDKYIIFYALFVLFYLISGVHSGYSDESVRYVISYYFVAIVGYLSTVHLISKTHGTGVLLSTVIAVGCFNSIITIDQLLHFGNFDTLLMQLHLDKGFEDFSFNHTNYETAGDNEFIFALPGIFQDPVANGYFSSVAAICSLFLPFKRNRIYTYIPWLLLMVGCFATQQRTAFVGAIICSIFAIYFIVKYREKERKFVFRLLPVLIIASIMCYLMINYSTPMETRYDNMADMGSRTNIYENSINFIMDNFVFGGIYSFFEQYHVYPHNLVFNAFIVGGIFGAIFIFAILFFHVKKLINSFASVNTNIKILIPALAIAGMLGDSLFHNQSIVYGDFTYWCFCAFLIAQPAKLEEGDLEEQTEENLPDDT